MSCIAELKNVSKGFNGITALDDVNLKIHEGEILALLGPNGSGKTTLLKILAFLEKPTSGEVYFCEEKVADKNREQARMNSTMVFQRTILFNSTVYDNVAYGLRMRKQSKNVVKEEVGNALTRVRLTGFQKRRARELSGGEQQRLALARALVLNTKLLLLDEPTANLDPKNASEMEEIIATVNRESKTTIVMATHNMFQAKNLPHRVALIANGRRGEVGTPTEIFGRLSKTLASFAALDNSFTGSSRLTEEGTSRIDIGNGVQIEAAVGGQGKVSVFVSPEDIIISKSPLESSARNVLRGKIVEIRDLGSLVRLRVDIGKPFTVQITKRSFNDMGLNLNAEVFLAFKASSVQTV